MTTVSPLPLVSRWDLAGEAIAVKIRWFGLLMGYFLVNVAGRGDAGQATLNIILAPGVLYAILDTLLSVRGRVFLGKYPLVTSVMEALFIGLLCHFQDGLDSPFRYYYLLSLICCAIRHATYVTYATYALHSASYAVLFFALPGTERRPLTLLLMLVVLGWMTWAADSLATLLKSVGEQLAGLNTALRENQNQLEARIVERTRELQESQAHVLHQEKMAAFGLLAAGIAHEVGNPLTSISSMIQMLELRDCDDYTRDKLALVGGQLQRIQVILRELINFSRPASKERSRFSLQEIVDEALNIAKYYKGTKARRIETDIPADLQPLFGVRNQLIQVLLNLILNAVDATEKGGLIAISAKIAEDSLEIDVRDEGCGVTSQEAEKLFQPYFTTKIDGTGLGLFVSRRLVADHGGTVTLKPNDLGGTTFRVRLPRPKT